MKYVALGLVVLTMVATNLMADSNSLAELRRAIEEKGARWTADVTSVSELSLEEQRRLCGTTLESYDLSPPEMGTPSVRTRDSFSWTDHEGYNWLTYVQDQEDCGSCWAFGACGALEVMLKILADCPASQVDLSEQNLLSCSPGDCDGYNIPGTLTYLQYYGTVDEQCFPYYADDGLPCDDRCTDWEFCLRYASSWGAVPGVIEQIKTKLLDGPLTVGFIVYQDFYDYSGGIYEHVNGNYVGSHCVVMCGWNDADSCWICKNSWDTNWGEDGYFRIKWGECAMEQNVYWVSGTNTDYPFLYSIGESFYEIEGDGDLVLNPGETVSLELALENECTYADAYDIEAILRTDEPMLAVVDSEAVYVDLAPGASGINSQDPFVVDISEDAGVGTYYLTAYVTANEGTAHPYWNEIEIALEVTLNSSGWPFASGCAIKSSPALVDLNQDGTLDVVFGGGRWISLCIELLG